MKASTLQNLPKLELRYQRFMGWFRGKGHELKAAEWPILDMPPANPERSTQSEAIYCRAFMYSEAKEPSFWSMKAADVHGGKYPRMVFWSWEDAMDVGELSEVAANYHRAYCNFYRAVGFKDRYTRAMLEAIEMKVGRSYSAGAAAVTINGRGYVVVARDEQPGTGWSPAGWPGDDVVPAAKFLEFPSGDDYERACQEWLDTMGLIRG